MGVWVFCSPLVRVTARLGSLGYVVDYAEILFIGEILHVGYLEDVAAGRESFAVSGRGDVVEVRDRFHLFLLVLSMVAAYCSGSRARSSSFTTR